MDGLFVYHTLKGEVDLGPIENPEGRTTNERPRWVRAEDGEV